VHNSFSLDESIIDNITQVSEVKNNMLVKPFSEEEVHDIVFPMEHNKAPGQDEFSTGFYKSCLDIIKEYLMALFSDFHKGNLPLYSLNFGMIILLPKCKEVAKIQQYRLITLLSASFKLFY
jgi:hypothetical protein